MTFSAVPYCGCCCSTSSAMKIKRAEKVLCSKLNQFAIKRSKKIFFSILRFWVLHNLSNFLFSQIKFSSSFKFPSNQCTECSDCAKVSYQFLKCLNVDSNNATLKSSKSRSKEWALKARFKLNGSAAIETFLVITVNRHFWVQEDWNCEQFYE